MSVIEAAALGLGRLLGHIALGHGAPRRRALSGSRRGGTVEGSHRVPVCSRGGALPTRTSDSEGDSSWWCTGGNFCRRRRDASISRSSRSSPDPTAHTAVPAPHPEPLGLGHAAVRPSEPGDASAVPVSSETEFRGETMVLRGDRIEATGSCEGGCDVCAHACSCRGRQGQVPGPASGATGSASSYALGHLIQHGDEKADLQWRTVPQQSVQHGRALALILADKPG